MKHAFADKIIIMKYSSKIAQIYFKDCGLPEPMLEYKFHPSRRWRFDFAWPEYKIALEVEGGIFVYGRHTRGSGFLKDMEKYNAAAMMGWRILRVQPKDLCLQTTVDMITETIGNLSYLPQNTVKFQ